MISAASTTGLVLSLIFGAGFGWLLQRGKVANCNVIVRQFLFQDFTVIKIMLTAIIVGGIGVFLMKNGGLVQFHIKQADVLAIAMGAAIFGVGMVVLGYCPGTALAAIGAGSAHALVGALGMLVGGVLYALSFDWVKANILPVVAMGKVQLPELLGVSPAVIFAVLTVVALGLFYALEKKGA